MWERASESSRASNPCRPTRRPNRCRSPSRPSLWSGTCRESCCETSCGSVPRDRFRKVRRGCGTYWKQQRAGESAPAEKRAKSGSPKLPSAAARLRRSRIDPRIDYDPRQSPTHACCGRENPALLAIQYRLMRNIMSLKLWQTTTQKPIACCDFHSEQFAHLHKKPTSFIDRAPSPTPTSRSTASRTSLSRAVRLCPCRRGRSDRLHHRPPDALG